MSVAHKVGQIGSHPLMSVTAGVSTSQQSGAKQHREHNGDRTVEMFVAHMATSGKNHDETDTTVWLLANARKASWHKAGK